MCVSDRTDRPWCQVSEWIDRVEQRLCISSSIVPFLFGTDKTGVVFKKELLDSRYDPRLLSPLAINFLSGLLRTTGQCLL